MIPTVIKAGTALIAFSLAACAQTSVSKAPACTASKDYRAIASRPIRNGKQILAADVDSRILLVSAPDSGATPDIEPLGYEQPVPSDFPYSNLLPKDEAVTTLRRVTCADQHWKVWVAETVGFAPQETRTRGSVPLNDRILVFREPAGADGKPLLLDERYREILDLTVDDINDDQRTEIAAQYADAEQGPWMKIWQIADNGLLRPIPLDNIKKDLTAVPGHVEIGLGDYRHGGELLFTEQRLQTAKGWHVTRRFYDWDDAHQRYQLAEVVQSDEITIK